MTSNPATRPTNARRGLRVGVPAFATDAGRSGIGQYLGRLLDAWNGVAPDDELDVLVPRDEVAPASGPGLHSIAMRRVPRQPVLNLMWFQAGLPGWCRRRQWDVLFLPAANRRVPALAPCPTVGTVHDLAILHVSDKYDAARRAYLTRVLPRLLRRLDRVITVSEASRRDVIEAAGVAPERVHVVPNGVDHARFTPGNRELARRAVASHLEFDAPYFVYVARFEHPGKNHVRLIEAFDTFKRRTGAPHRLVLAGPDWSGADAIHAAIDGARCTRHIVRAGFLPAALLPDLYRAAEGLVFPSLFEGFGLPLLEAMACGTPVATSNAGALPEVAGRAALSFDPQDPDAIAHALEQLASDAGLRSSLRAMGYTRSRQFSWARTARETQALLARTALEAA